MFPVCIAGKLNGEGRIIKDLLENYSIDARPVLNDSHTVNVKFDLELNQVIDIVRIALSNINSDFSKIIFWTIK